MASSLESHKTKVILLFFVQHSMDAARLDDIINRLLEVRYVRPGKLVDLTDGEIRQLCSASRAIFLDQPNLLEIVAPVKICGRYYIIVDMIMQL